MGGRQMMLPLKTIVWGYFGEFYFDLLIPH